MNLPEGLRRTMAVAILSGLCAPGVGCQVFGQAHQPLPPGPGSPQEVARELNMVTLPDYTLAPPDILLVEAVRVVPKPPYKIEPLDIVQIVVSGTLLDQPIANAFQVQPAGTVDLGPSYGAVKVAGLTMDEAAAAIDRQLRQVLGNPEVSVTLVQVGGSQQIAGEHLIGPDGKVNLGTYGSVFVTGKTLDEARAAIETHLSQFLESPKVSVSVLAYNSKVYYIIMQGAGLGDQLVRVPATGGETVLDALAQVQGVSRLASKQIWIARPAPYGLDCDQVLPVDWDAITAGASTATNYQVFPGDRIYVAEDKMVAFDTMVQKLTSPFERMFGFSLLGAQSVQTMNRFPKGFRNF